MNCVATPISFALGSAAAGNDEPNSEPVFTADKSPASSEARTASAPLSSPASRSCGCHSSLLQPMSKEALRTHYACPTRQCYECRRVLPLEDFAKHVARDSGAVFHNRRCNSCRARRQQGSALVQAKKAIVEDGKCRPCTDCGGQFDPTCMRYYHTRGEKTCDAPNAYRFLPMERLKLELAKCDVVCANCARIRAARDGHVRGRKRSLS